MTLATFLLSLFSISLSSSSQCLNLFGSIVFDHLESFFFFLETSFCGVRKYMWGTSDKDPHVEVWVRTWFFDVVVVNCGFLWNSWDWWEVWVGWQVVREGVFSIVFVNRSFWFDGWDSINSETHNSSRNNAIILLNYFSIQAVHSRANRTNSARDKSRHSRHLCHLNWNQFRSFITRLLSRKKYRYYAHRHSFQFLNTWTNLNTFSFYEISIFNSRSSVFSATDSFCSNLQVKFSRIEFLFHIAKRWLKFFHGIISFRVAWSR